VTFVTITGIPAEGSGLCDFRETSTVPVVEVTVVVRCAPVLLLLLLLFVVIRVAKENVVNAITDRITIITIAIVMIAACIFIYDALYAILNSSYIYPLCNEKLTTLFINLVL
jgi:chromate transport protein ChrA